MNAPDTLKHYAALAAQASKDADDLARFRGVGAKPQAGCQFIRLDMGSTEVLIEYEYEAGEESFISGPPEDCYEGSPEELNICGVLINGDWCDPTEFASETQIEVWKSAILAHMENLREADMIDRYESSREYA